MKKLLFLIVSAVFAGQAYAVAPLQLNYIGQNILPTGTQFSGTTIGGLSGIDYDATSQSYYAISDDRSGVNSARFYNLNLDLSQFNRNVAPGFAGVSFNSVTTLQTPGGVPFATNTVDPESIRFKNGSLFWTNEGQRAASGAPAFQNPTVREMQLNGTYVRDFNAPTYYNPVGVAGTVLLAGPNDSGIRNNLAFESLTFSNDGNTLYTATENALAQDGPPATFFNPTENRVLAFNAATGNVSGEYVYVTDAVVDQPSPINGFQTNGLVELLNVPGMNDTFIAVERSFSAGTSPAGGAIASNGGTGNNIRLYLTSLAGATNIQGISDLQNAGAYARMGKELLLDLDTLTNSDGSPFVQDNIEGITWGPSVNGNPTLILVSDNNFGANQFTQFVAFEVKTVPVPAAFWLFGSALAGLVARARPRA